MTFPLCACDHGIGLHDIAKDGTRTRCSVMSGPRGVPCPCQRFTPSTKEPTP